MLDIVLVVLAVVAAVGGYRLGFVARAASWLGMALGVAVAARLLPAVVESLSRSADRSQLALVGIGLLVGGAFAGQAIGLVLGGRLQVNIPESGRRVDSLGGAAAGLVGLLVIVWMLVPAAADVRGWQAREVRRSRIVTAVSDRLPEPPDATRTLRGLVGDGFPRVFDDLDRAPDVGPPPAETGLSQATAEAVGRSIVKVVGAACGQIQEGSGFVIDGGLVVTNAHVVAGEETTTLERDDGFRVEATLVAFDPRRDVAVLRARGIDRPPLAVAGSMVDQRGAVFGHPGGGPLELSPFVVAERVGAVGTDIYGRRGISRDVLVLASDLAPGDSGSALIDPQGRVVGVAFAIAPDRPGVAYALATTELRAVLETVGGDRVDAGGCAA